VHVPVRSLAVEASAACVPRERESAPGVSGEALVAGPGDAGARLPERMAHLLDNERSHVRLDRGRLLARLDLASCADRSEEARTAIRAAGKGRG
jgi:hypothetical protein